MSTLSDIAIKAKPRDERGKEKAKKLRAAGWIPAILYGGGIKDQAYCLHAHDVSVALTRAQGAVHRLKIDVEGGEPFEAVFKHIQRDPVTTDVVHVDLFPSDGKSAVTLEVPVQQTGDIPVGVKIGGTLERVTFRVGVRGVAEKIPSRIDLDLSNLEAGKTVCVRDLPAFDGVEYTDKPERVIFVITAKRGTKLATGAEAAAAKA